ncbi:MAG: universal stress protein [Blastocatellia bacterium]
MTRIQRILCPTQRPAVSDSALRYAIALARAYEAELSLCHFVEPDVFVDVTERERYQRQFEQLILSLHGDTGQTPPRTQAIILNEDPITGIPELARKHGVDLIVMQSRRRPLAAALLGSMTEAVCRTAPCPVLVTHPDEHDFITPENKQIALRRILVAHDFSNDSELAMQYALSLAQEYQAELHVMHVLPFAVAPVVTRLPQSLENDYERAMRMLRQAVPEETYLWSHVTPMVRTGQPYREILTYAEDHAMDLICLGVHGAGFAMRALFGSNADRVLRQAPCPVLITRPLKPAMPAGKNGTGQEEGK